MLKKILGLMLSIAVMTASFSGICPVSAAASSVAYVSIDRSNGINVGDTLEAVPTFAGTVDGSEAVSYQWKRIKIENKIVGKSSIEGTGGVGDYPYLDIEGATEKTYKITEADSGYIIKVEATYNGKTVFSGDCAAVGNILSSYSNPTVNGYSLKRYKNATTADNPEGTYTIGELDADATEKFGELLINSNNADQKLNFANAGSGQDAFYSCKPTYIIVTEHELSMPADLQSLLVETGYPNSAQPIPDIFVQVKYENETEYKDWAQCLDWGRTSAEANSDSKTKFQRYFFHYLTADSELVGSDSGKKVSAIKVIICPRYDKSASGNVYVREISAFAKPYAAISSIEGLDGAYLDGAGIADIPLGTTAGELINAIKANAYTTGVKIVGSDKLTEVADDAALEGTMYVELSLSDSGEKTYYTIAIAEAPTPSIEELALDTASFDNDGCVIKDIVDGIRAGELLKALKVKDASSVRVVAFDKETLVEDDMYINETMLLELMPLYGTDVVYYTIEMAAADIADGVLRNLALAASIVCNGAYTSAPITSAIDGRNDTQFASAQNKDASNSTSSYRPYGEPPVVNLTLDAESIISKIEAYMNYDYCYLNLEYSLDQKTWNTLGTTAVAGKVKLEDTGTLDGEVVLQVLEFSPVKARFIRATLTADQNLSLRHFNIWGVYDNPPIVTDNLAYNKNGDTSEYNVATRASNMFDLKKDTRWRSKNGENANPWISVDFGETKNVGSIIVYDDAEDVNYEIFSSMDSVEWKSVGKTILGNEASEPYVKKYEGFTEARYVKLVSDKAKDISIFELEAYKGENPDLISDDLVKGKNVTSTVAAVGIENDASKVADGDDGTSFMTATGSPYKITVDLGKLEEISRIVISEPDGTYNIDAFSVRVSEDKANWYNVGSGYGIGSEKSFGFDTKKVRYIELAVSSVSAVPSGISTISAYSDTSSNEEIKKAIENTDVPELITNTYELPTSYNNIVDISWQSSDESIIKVVNGETVIDEPTKDTAVTLTAVFTYNTESETVVYQTTVEGSKKTNNKGSGGSGGGGGSGSGGVFSAAAPADSFIGESVVKADENKTDIKDELKGHWGEVQIRALVEKEIVKGDNGSLHLKRTVTRAEFGAMLVRGLGLEASEYSGDFEDIKSTDWFAKEIQSLINSEIMVGADSMFRPNDSITRQEMAVVVSKVAEFILNIEKNDEYELSFADGEEISNWAVDAVKLAAQNEFISGFEDGEFKPLELLKREQAMVVIYKLMDKGGRI